MTELYGLAWHDSQDKLRQSAVNALPEPAAKAVMEVQNSPDPGCFPADLCQQLATYFSNDPLVLARELMAFGCSYSRGLVSKFRVAAVAIGESGAMYVGCNLEYPELGLTASMHAEQAAISLASRFERVITTVVTSAEPCGRCRQFMGEIAQPPQIYPTNHNRPFTLEELLPNRFTPEDLGQKAGLCRPYQLDTASIETAARSSAQASFAPYSGAPAGVALQVADGRIFAGRYIESCAFNPTLPPVATALVPFAMSGLSPVTIREVCIVSSPDNRVHPQTLATEWLRSIAPQATIHHLVSQGAPKLEVNKTAG